MVIGRKVQESYEWNGWHRKTHDLYLRYVAINQVATPKLCPVGLEIYELVDALFKTHSWNDIGGGFQPQPPIRPLGIFEMVLSICVEGLTISAQFGRRDTDRATRATLDTITNDLNTCLTTRGLTGTQSHQILEWIEKRKARESVEDYFKIVLSIIAKYCPSSYVTPVSCPQCNASNGESKMPLSPHPSMPV